jgi:hypothetical protein
MGAGGGLHLLDGARGSGLRTGQFFQEEVRWGFLGSYECEFLTEMSACHFYCCYNKEDFCYIFGN